MKKCLLIFCLLVFSCLALGERLPLKTYTTADGLAHNVVNKIVRDSHGFLWFCTNEGLSRFDGYSFTNYGTSQGLPDAVVNDLLETNGVYWVATNGGLVRFDPKGTAPAQVNPAVDAPRFTVVLPDNQDRHARIVNTLLAGRDGTLWCGADKGLYRLDQSNGGLKLLAVDIGFPLTGHEPSAINDLMEDQNGSLWIATPYGLYRRWPDGRSAHYDKTDGLPDDYLHDLLRDHLGQLWAGTRYGGFFRFTADESQNPPKIVFKFGQADGLPTGWVFRIFESSDLRFWVATARGLVEFLPGAKPPEPRFRVYNETNGLIYHDVTTLAEDLAGNLWLGSYLGAMRLAHNGFTTYDAADGVLAVNAIFADQAGNVGFRARVNGDGKKSIFEGAKLDLLHPAGEQVMRFGSFDGRGFTWFLPQLFQSQLDYGWVGEGVTLQAKSGEWWVGTGAGLCRFPRAADFSQLKDARPLNVYKPSDGLAGPQVFRLFEDSRGDLWISTIAAPNGLARWDHVRQKVVDLANTPGAPSLTDNLARSFGEDVNGNVWIGFGGGVARYRDGGFTFFTVNEGLPPGAVQYVYRDRSNRLWLASARGGLIRVDQPDASRPSFISYGTAQGLTSDEAEVITEDLNGNIYVGTGRGLDRFDPRTGGIKHFTTADGLAGGEFLAAFRDREGALWLGTQKGMSRVLPEPDHQSAPPPILIAGLQVADTPRIVSAVGEAKIELTDLPSNQNHLQIDYLALGFESGEVLRYQYKLEGADADWGAPTPQRSVTYARLAPGHYRFLVRAVNSDGVLSPDPAAVVFTILPPIWQRWWFVLLAILFIAAIVFALFRYRVDRILELANIRTRIAADLHDDIGSNLTRIAILSEVARSQLADGEKEMEHPLRSIAEISRDSVASMGDIVWAINPKRDSFFDLVQRMRRFTTEMLGHRGIEYDFHAPELSNDFKVGANIRRDLYLFFKEAVNNAVRHSRCQNVAIDLALRGSSFVLTVRDDGEGFDAAKVIEGQGLVSMKRRAGHLGGALRISSTPGQGTEIILTFPRRKS